MSSPIAADRYRYKALQNTRAIRLLTLEPSSDFNSPLTCSLTEVSLDQSRDASNSYEALSYVWGSGYGDSDITCDGKRLLITPNCGTALRSLRYRHEPRILWVDAICIDQSSEEARSIQERNEQVKMMGEIYRGAECVLVWIGDGDHSTTTALGYMATIGKYWRMRQSKNKVKQFIAGLGLKYYGERLTKFNGEYTPSSNLYTIR
jgi:Heterokaryon incompatibility protein (HET)